MIDTSRVKCPGCGANLPFDATIGKWRCPSCNSVWDELQVLNLTKDSDQDIKNAEQNINLYKCEGCGAEVVGDATTSATTCAFCGNSIVLKGRLEGDFRPSGIIPFTHTKEQAMEQFRKILKKEWFVPSEFTEQKCLESMQPIYIPFWLYNGNSEGQVDGYYTTKRSWKTGNYRHTETTHWNVEIGGHASFCRVPADGSVKFDDKLMDSIEPFDYSGLIPFNYAYLSGFMAEKYDVSADEASGRASERMTQALSAMLAGSYEQSISVTENKIQSHTIQPEYVLLPVWILNTRYQDQPITFAMNGQTGKMVGNTPISKKKQWIFALSLFLGLFLTMELIMFIMYIMG